jgi:predicted RNA-binding Zn-ribbon protein involved in translation (DUF1610 family)
MKFTICAYCNAMIPSNLTMQGLHTCPICGKAQILEATSYTLCQRDGSVVALNSGLNMCPTCGTQAKAATTYAQQIARISLYAVFVIFLMLPVGCFLARSSLSSLYTKMTCTISFVDYTAHVRTNSGVQYDPVLTYTVLSLSGQVVASGRGDMGLAVVNSEYAAQQETQPYAAGHTYPCYHASSPFVWTDTSLFMPERSLTGFLTNVAVWIMDGLICLILFSLVGQVNIFFFKPQGLKQRGVASVGQLIKQEWRGSGRRKRLYSTIQFPMRLNLPIYCQIKTTRKVSLTRLSRHECISWRRSSSGG